MQTQNQIHDLQFQDVLQHIYYSENYLVHLSIDYGKFVPTLNSFFDIFLDGLNWFVFLITILCFYNLDDHKHNTILLPSVDTIATVIKLLGSTNNPKDKFSYTKFEGKEYVCWLFYFI